MVHLAPGVDPTLQAIVSELTRVARPELILLFGSRAAGNAREDSDYDLMLVFADDANVDADRRACSAALWDAHISADVLARSASQYARAQHDPGFLDWLVAREGRVVYSSGRVAQRSPPRVRERNEGYDAWCSRALADLRVATREMRASDPVAEAVCFHAHACAEKLLKARLVQRNSFPPRTHDVLRLLDLQEPALRSDSGVRGACRVLQELYRRSRYPEHAMPALEDARTALAAAEKVRAVLG